MNRIFIDMDGVIVDFDGFKKIHGLTGQEVKKRCGAYLDMDPMPGALFSVKSLIGMGYDVWIATKPPTGIAFAYADKAAWIFKHLPELKRKIIITHDKGLLGDDGDWLIDDRPHKANCQQFKGTLLTFEDGFGWPEIINAFRKKPRPCFDVPIAADQQSQAQPERPRSAEETCSTFPAPHDTDSN